MGKMQKGFLCETLRILENCGKVFGSELLKTLNSTHVVTHHSRDLVYRQGSVWCTLLL